MRTWRVGTFSMGASLLLLGIFLLMSQIFGLKLTHVMMSWWPVILVVLGIEILVFLFLSRQEKPFLKYDFLSIFFVGVLGTVGIGFAILSSTGILEKMDDVLQREERTLDLPAFEHKINNEVKRVVVHTGRYPLTVEGTTGKDVSMFGTYRALTGKNEKLISKTDDYVSVQAKGDTIYVSVKDLPRESVGPFDRYATMSATILIPNDVKLEVIGNDYPITVKPRTLMSDWAVDNAASISVHIQNSSDVLVTATDVQEIQGAHGKWNMTNEQKSDAEIEEPVIKHATFQTGKGSHQLQLMNSYQVSLNTID
ncbi:hypothetical protein BGM26_15270 [Bacillus sp. FJAT-29790]|uniref:hypothetical protein n=1 Tax=Bacillus sp. FJAT-29790 TaxID=1895002 RepID=UPI001C2189B2|nr:hypothetical protein [Bacillus sp. FJAT-29790]MBU8880311.1 hypothetical protein [Bacillus sp. FJAT-29790]